LPSGNSKRFGTGEWFKGGGEGTGCAPRKKKVGTKSFFYLRDWEESWRKPFQEETCPDSWKEKK